MQNSEPYYRGPKLKNARYIKNRYGTASLEKMTITQELSVSFFTTE
jgi:hypothetical protein